MQRANKLPFLFEDNPHPMWVIDRKTLRFLAVNRQAVSRYGWSKKEFLRMSLYDIRTREEAERLRKLDITKVVHPSIWQHRTKSGRLLDVTINSSPVDFEGRPAMLALAQDVTARLEAERALRREKETLKDYLDTFAGIFVVLDPRGRVKLINGQGCQVLGLPESRILGRDWFARFIPKRMRASMRRFYAEIIAGRATFDVFENPIVSKRGELSVRWRNSALRGPDGRITAVLCSGEDVTEKRRVEDALAQTRRRHEALFQHAREAIFFIDRAGILIEANPAACALLRTPRQRIVGRSFLDFTPKAERPRGRDLFSRYLKTARSTGDYRVVASDGQIVSIEYHAVGEILPGVGLIVARDVTQERRSALRLKQSEERYRLLVENWPEAIATHQDGRFVFANAAAVELFGARKASDLIGRLVLEVVHPEARAAVKARLKRLSRGVKAPWMEQRVLRLDGTQAWVEIAAVPTSHEGRPAVQIFGRDVSERVAAREALRHSEERYRLLVENWPAAVLIHQEGIVRFANPACLRMFGAEKAAQLLGRAVMDMVHPDYRARVRQRLGKLSSTGGAPPADELLLRVDGSPVWAEIAAVATTFEGRPAVQVFARDITDRVSGREALRLSEERLRLLVEGVKDYAMLMLDDQGRVAVWNEGARRLMGYEAMEVLGRPFATFFRDAQTPARLLRTATEDGRADAEGWRRRRDGSWFWASGVLTAIRGSDGALQGFVKVVRDVTELRRLERETIEFSAREQRRLGQDLHDGLGQHLTGLSLLAQALAGKLHVEGPELAAQAERIAALAREAIDQTRALSHGLDPVEAGPEGLADALERLSASASSLLSVRCLFEMGEDARIPDHSQAVQLYRIAQEAVNNAVKHGRAAVVNMRLQVSGGTVTLTVKDDGVGLPARPKRGAGRGLHTMGYRARTMGGLLKVANDEMGGAIVICTCPLQEAPVSTGSKT